MWELCRNSQFESEICAYFKINSRVLYTNVYTYIKIRKDMSKIYRRIVARTTHYNCHPIVYGRFVRNSTLLMIQITARRELYCLFASFVWRKLHRTTELMRVFNWKPRSIIAEWQCLVISSKLRYRKRHRKWNKYRNLSSKFSISRSLHWNYKGRDHPCISYCIVAGFNIGKTFQYRYQISNDSFSLV